MKKVFFVSFCFILSLFLISCQKSETNNLAKENSEEISNVTIPSHLEMKPGSGLESKPDKEDPADCCIDCTATVQVQLPIPSEYDLWIRGVCPNGDQGPLIGHYDETNTPSGYIEFTMFDEQIYQFTALSSAGALFVDVTDIFGTETLLIGDMVFPEPNPPVPPVSNNIYVYEKLDCNLYTTSVCYTNGVRNCCFNKAYSWIE